MIHALLVSISFFLLAAAQGQTINLDSCGFDSDSQLNKYEIHFADSFLFPTFNSKKARIDPKKRL